MYPENYDMKLYSWNVNGIRAVLRKDNFHPFINDAKPDILCLQETKAQPGDVEVGLVDYHEYWHSAEKKGYSGTAIYSRVEPLNVTRGISDAVLKNYGATADDFGAPNLEGRVLTAEYPDFYLVTVYTPNAKEDLSRIPLRHNFWDPAFLAHCQELEKTKPVVFCGDYSMTPSLPLCEPVYHRRLPSAVSLRMPVLAEGNLMVCISVVGGSNRITVSSLIWLTQTMPASSTVTA